MPFINFCVEVINLNVTLALNKKENFESNEQTDGAKLDFKK